jgi:hypothetical protein
MSSQLNSLVGVVSIKDSYLTLRDKYLGLLYVLNHVCSLGDIIYTINFENAELQEYLQSTIIPKDTHV